MKVFKKIVKTIYILLVVLLILSATFILLTTYDVNPKYNFYVVMSGSMEPAIKTGSVIGVKQEEKYRLKDIVTIEVENDPSRTFTHRIVEIVEEDEETKYITKGDANETEDPEPVLKEAIVGKNFFSVPLFGYIVNFAKQPTGFILMVIIPAVVIIASELNVIKEEFSKIIKSRKKKDEI